MINSLRAEALASEHQTHTEDSAPAAESQAKRSSSAALIQTALLILKIQRTAERVQTLNVHLHVSACAYI